MNLLNQKRTIRVSPMIAELYAPGSVLPVNGQNFKVIERVGVTELVVEPVSTLSKLLQVFKS